MTWINNQEKTYFNFKAPVGFEEGIHEVVFPIGKKETASIDNNVLSVEAKNQYNYFDKVDASADFTLKAEMPYGLPVGAELLIPVHADGSNVVITLGSGFDGDVSQSNIAISDGETKTLLFKWNGKQFLKIG